MDPTPFIPLDTRPIVEYINQTIERLEREMSMEGAKKRVEIRDKNGISAFTKVVPRAANQLAPTAPPTVFRYATVTQEQDVAPSGASNIKIQRVSPTEYVVETNNGTMRLSNGELHSELQKFNINPPIPAISALPKSCKSCKSQSSRIRNLEESLKLESDKQKDLHDNVANMNIAFQQREWFWMGQTHNLVQQLEYYKALSNQVPLNLAVNNAQIGGLADQFTPPSSQPSSYRTPGIFPIQTRPEPTLFWKSKSQPPKPLSPDSEEYKQLLAQARENFEKCPVYKDEKIVTRSCLFDAKSDITMPQTVSNPQRAWLLYRKWRESSSTYISNWNASEDWSAMKTAQTKEFIEWRTRAITLSEEHKDQLAKGYIKVTTRRPRINRMARTANFEKKVPLYKRELIFFP